MKLISLVLLTLVSACFLPGCGNDTTGSSSNAAGTGGGPGGPEAGLDSGGSAGAGLGGSAGTSLDASVDAAEEPVTDSSKPDSDSPAGSPYPIFTAPGNIWTTPLPDDAPLDPNGAAVVANLVKQLDYRNHPEIAWYTDEWHSSIGTDWQRIWPVIPAGTKTKRVLWIDGNLNPVDPESEWTSQPLQSWLDEVPVPDLPIDVLRSEGGGDKPMIVYQESTDTLWEFWILDNQGISNGAYHAPDGSSTPADYTCRYGGRIRPVSQSLGVYEYDQGSSATSLSYANGLIMLRDAIAGKIDHAITLTLPVTGPFVAPATRDDAKSATKIDCQQDQVSEGTLFRLPPSFDPQAFAPGSDDRSVFMRLVLTAIRDYGMYVGDTGPCININAEGTAVAALDTLYYDLPSSKIPSWWGAEGIFWGKGNLTLDMPWDQLQVVAPHSARDW